MDTVFDCLGIELKEGNEATNGNGEENKSFIDSVSVLIVIGSLIALVVILVLLLRLLMLAS